MPLNSYITATEYSEVTDRDNAEATGQRLKRASMLLDVRCGLHAHTQTKGDDGILLIDVQEKTERQKEIIKQWVAWLVFSLVENEDSVQVDETIRLGRFQSTARERNELVPDHLLFADQMLKSSGLIRRDIRSNKNQVNVQRSLDVIGID